MADEDGHHKITVAKRQGNEQLGSKAVMCFWRVICFLSCAGPRVF